MADGMDQFNTDNSTIMEWYVPAAKSGMLYFKFVQTVSKWFRMISFRLSLLRSSLRNSSSSRHRTSTSSKPAISCTLPGFLADVILNWYSNKSVRLQQCYYRKSQECWWFCRCHYTKSNPIDDHSNISSKKLQKQNFKPLGHYTCMQCGTSHLQTIQENILSHIILAIYRKFTVATVRFTQSVSCNIYTHPRYINKWQMSLCNNSSDNKSYWIHMVDVKVSAQVTTVTYMHQSQPSLHSSVYISWCTSNSDLAITWFGAMTPACYTYSVVDRVINLGSRSISLPKFS